MSERREGESVTAFTIRRLTNDVVEICAKVAEAEGKRLDEPAIGAHIARAIRKECQT